MTGLDRSAVAFRWTAAMSSKAASAHRAVADVLADDVRTSTVTGKAAVLDWLKTAPGMSMFRTGTWRDPTVMGDVVTFETVFDSKASYYGARVSITVSTAGLITHAGAVILPAPDPLGSVILRVWGSRTGVDSLPEHLESSYRVEAKKITQLDHGVFKADLRAGSPWIVRLFPSDRPIADVKADAKILRFLEDRDFPAERVVGDVTEHEGQGVLVTEFVKGPKPKLEAKSWRELGRLIGVLHSIKGASKVVKRPTGALHLYTADCQLGTEISTAREALQAGAFRGKDRTWESLVEGLHAAPGFDGLPTALIHPDPGTVNTISRGKDLVLIDWAGVGFGPRVLGLSLLLVPSATGKSFNKEWVDAIMETYTEHVKLTPAELDHLDAAIAYRPLIHEAYSWCVGMARQRKPSTMKMWPHNNVGIAAMADHIRTTWG